MIAPSRTAGPGADFGSTHLTEKMAALFGGGASAISTWKIEESSRPTGIGASQSEIGIAASRITVTCGAK